tara:strand:- start:131 stop:2011 length:1881 start_codon:yes stop_codon:yes gene_type:complete
MTPSITYVKYIISLFFLIFYTNQSLGNDLEIKKFVDEYDKSNSIILDEISVSASKIPLELSKTGSTVKIITKKEIQNSSETFLIDFLNSTSGISIDQTGPTGSISSIRIRGNSPHYSKIFIDGIDITKTSATQATPYLEKFLLKDFERIEVLKGNQSALYGSQAIAGVISLTTKKPSEDGITNKYSLVYGSNSTTDIAYTFSNRTEKNDFSIKVQRFDTDGFSAADKKDGNTENDGYKNTNFHLKNTYYINENFSLDFGGFKINDKGDFDGFPPPNYNLADSSSHYYKEKSEGFNVGGNLISSFLNHSFNYSYYNSDRNNYGPTAFDNYQSKGKRDSYSYKASKNINSKYNIVGGIDLIEDAATISNKNKSSNITGLFLENIYDFSKDITTTLGLRQDSHSQFGEKLVYRTSFAYNYNGLIFRGSHGTGYRAPSLYELFETTNGYGNENLKPEESINTDIGISSTLSAYKLKLSGSIFNSMIENRIEFDNGVNGYKQVTTKEKREGYEIDADYAISKSTNAKIAYTNVTDEKGNHVRKIPKNKFSITVDSDLTDNIDSSFKLTSVSDLKDGSTLPDYNILDAKFSYNLEDYNVILKIDNIFDEQYQVVKGYGTADRSFYLGIDGEF